METRSDSIHRSVVPHHHVRVASEAARVAIPGQAGLVAEPHVTLIRDGDVVKAVEIVCSCGQRLRLNCVY